MGSLMSKSDNCSTDAGEIGEPISFCFCFCFFSMIAKLLTFIMYQPTMIEVPFLF